MYKGKQIVVVDDASEDGTAETVGDYAPQMNEWRGAKWSGLGESSM